MSSYLLATAASRLLRHTAARGSYALAATTSTPAAALSASVLAGKVRSFASLPSHEVLTMPALSPTMTEGNISAWKKKEGDAIAAGDILCDVETDKATMEWECVEDGVLAKILIAEGAQGIAVGTPVCVLAEEGADISAFASFTADAAAAPAAPAAAPAAPAAAAAPTPTPAAAPAAPAVSGPPAGNVPPPPVGTLKYIDDASVLSTNRAGWAPGCRPI
ncbi:hypothetical protein PPROV_000368400 [Pycnococcus provasolii]|uniref:Lipoyl-binding domain-containing protein n=1 Tax=Pycnococcus provasolii TaxID=41880 RepID=A0A830HE12_9CHLO|nr:hypothetical protein PPROV_000368400 [Pycnococcus provasolii]